MKSYGRRLTATCAALSVVLIGINGCSQAKQTGTGAASSQQGAGRHHSAEPVAPPKSDKLADLQKQIKARSARYSEAQQRIQVVLGQSDVELQAAKQYRSESIKTKNSTLKKQLLAKAERAQYLADRKAQELLELRRSLSTELPAITSLKAKIEIAQKENESVRIGTKVQATADTKPKLSGRPAGNM